MKILMPYVKYGGVSIHDDKIIGGIEKFARHIHKEIPGVIPVEFTPEDQKRRKVNAILERAIVEHQPDVILTNYDFSSASIRLHDVAKAHNIPMLWISHHASGSISRISHVAAMKKFTEQGGTLAMVSEKQRFGMNKLANRINGCNLDLNGGLVAPSFSFGNEVVSDWDYEAVTVGRSNTTKKPFWLHTKASGSDLRTVVLTQKNKDVMSGKHSEYAEKHQHWTYPQETIFDLTHVDTMLKMSQAMVYVSTCPIETWGITAMEALCHGLPLILVTDASGVHASETIAGSPEHITKIKGTCARSVFVDAVKAVKLRSLDERHEIAGMAKEKNSIEAWRSGINRLIDQTIETHKKQDAQNENLGNWIQ